MTNHEEDNPINWDEIIKSGKGVIASDRKRSGTVIAQTEDDVVISDGVVKRHQFIMPKRKDFKNITPYSYSLLHNQNSKTYYNNHNNTYIYPDYVTINSLDIADGLKEMLIKYGFTLEELSSMPSSELAEFLGIDKYIAQIIGSAVVKLSNDNCCLYDTSSVNLQTRSCNT